MIFVKFSALLLKFAWTGLMKINHFIGRVHDQSIKIHSTEPSGKRMIAFFNSILIETTNTCTRQCWFCKFGQDRKDEKKIRMDWETIEKIVYNLRDIKYKGRISWFLINEPLIDDRIFEIVRFTKINCPRAFVSLSSNGDLLQENTYQRLRRCGLDAMGVNIYDDKTYHKISSFRNSQRLVLFDRRDPYRMVLDNRGGNIKEKSRIFKDNRLRFINYSCARPFHMMAVKATGQVVLCCADMYGDVVMGDTKKDRLETIWNNQSFAFYRECLEREGRKGLVLCQRCSYNGKEPRVFYPLKGKRGKLVLAMTRFASMLKNNPLTRQNPF